MRPNHRTDHHLISQIYQSIGDPDPFSTALDGLARRYDAKLASIMLIDAAAPSISGVFRSNRSQDKAADEYVERFGAPDMAKVKLLSAPKNGDLPMLSERTPAAGAEAAAWLQSQMGLEKLYSARLSATPIWTDLLTLGYPVGHLGLAQDIQTDVSQYMQHFKTALEMMRPFRLLKTRFKTVIDALDHLKIGVAILSNTGKLEHGNNRLHAILDKQDGLRLGVDGTLRFDATGDTTRRRFIQTLGRLCSADDPFSGRSGFVFPKRSGETSFVAELCALAPLMDRPNVGTGFAMLVIKDPQSTDWVSVDLVTQLFDLTSAEQDVCNLLVNGASVAEIAEQRSVSIGTTRNQVASIFQKTSCNSQTQLIQTALRVDLPVEEPTAKM